MIKLRKEIAELEANKEKIPDRLASLEKTVLELPALVTDAVDTALFISLKEAGWSSEEAKEYADGFVERNIMGGSH